MDKLMIGKGENPISLYTSKLNRHGFITGSTGSGKTITLKVLAEQLSKAGISVFISDVKGDVASLSEKGQVNEDIAERVELNGLDDFENRSFSCEFFDVYGDDGIPLRTTISDMGPILLSRLMGLNQTQEGVLNITFKIADEEGLMLIDTKDLRSMLKFVEDNRSEISTRYGNVSKQSIGAILRSLLVIEQQGGDIFFGEPAFDIKDFLRKDENGEGFINILASQTLFQYPKLYSTFLLWLLSELYETLPEVGDTEKPKIVFFFDEAHLLFDNSSQALQEMIQMITRLIRSKGVGIFYVTQKATDIPDEVLSQLGNRIQHSLRAYTPKEKKEVKAIADSFRQREDCDLEEEILNLEVGQAVVSVLDEDSKPTFAEKVLINPPMSKIGVVDPQRRNEVINKSSLYDKYVEGIDRESAYEILKQKEEEELARLAEEQRLKEEEKQAKEAKKEAEKEEKRSRSRSSRNDTVLDKLTKNIAGSVGRELGRIITRGIFGNKK